MPDVEAHITGTVWKIEVSQGDSVDEGDTVVITPTRAVLHRSPQAAGDGPSCVTVL